MQFDILITFTMKALFDCGKIVEIFSDRTTLDLIYIQYRVRSDLSYNQYKFAYNIFILRKIFRYVYSWYYWVFPQQNFPYNTKAIKCLYNQLWYNHIHSIFNVTCMTKAFCFKHTMYVKHVYWTKEEKLYFAQMLFIIWEDYHYNFHNHIFYIENIFWVVDNNLKTFHNCVLNACGALIQNMSSLSFSQRDD